MTTRIAPSAALEAAIEKMLCEEGLESLAEGERLTEIGPLGARPVLQGAVEDEVAAFMGCRPFG